MPLDFPNGPLPQQVFKSSDGTSWMWDGTKWVGVGSAGAYLPLSGGTLTGPLNVTATITSTTAVLVGGASGPSWTTGSTAPTAITPIGSLYSRAGGTVGATLYVSRGGGTWAAVAGV